MNQRPLLEKQITAQVRYILKLYGIFHWKIHQSLGCTPGVPDIVGITHGGRFFGCEIKTAKGKPSEHQERFLQAINDAGGLGFVAKSVDDVIEKLELKGFKPSN
jgi:hypothetical protein